MTVEAVEEMPVPKYEDTKYEDSDGVEISSDMTTEITELQVQLS